MATSPMPMPSPQRDKIRSIGVVPLPKPTVKPVDPGFNVRRVKAAPVPITSGDSMRHQMLSGQGDRATAPNEGMGQKVDSMVNALSQQKGKKLGWTKGVGNPHNPAAVKKNKAAVGRQEKMVSKLKSNKGKLGPKDKINLRLAATKRAKRQSGISGSIG